MQRDLKLTEMIPVYCYKKEFSIYCALIPSIQVERALSKSSWDLLFYHHEGDNGIEPLVINREFNESQINYGKRTKLQRDIRGVPSFFTTSITTERQINTLKLMTKAMNTQWLLFEPDYIQIRLQEIRQFLAIKEMYLSVQFSFEGDSAYSPEELGASEDERVGEGENKAD